MFVAPYGMHTLENPMLQLGKDGDFPWSAKSFWQLCFPAEAFRQTERLNKLSRDFDEIG